MTDGIHELRPKTDRPDIWRIADAIQMDLRAAQAKLVELRSLLSALNLPDGTKLTCEHCGLKFKGLLLLAEHLYHSHNGPEPDHWLALEARTLPPATREEIKAAMTEGAERKRAALEAQAAAAMSDTHEKSGGSG